jgi:hypothetical protein
MAQVVTITATSLEEPSVFDSVQVKIVDLSVTNFDGNTSLNPQLLNFANAFGSIDPEDLAKYDLNGDGKIDDGDLLMLFRVLRW